MRKIPLNRSTGFMYKLYQNDLKIVPTFVFADNLSQCDKYCLRLVNTNVREIDLIEQKHFPLKTRNGLEG